MEITIIVGLAALTGVILAGYFLLVLVVLAVQDLLEVAHEDV